MAEKDNDLDDVPQKTMIDTELRHGDEPEDEDKTTVGAGAPRPTAAVPPPLEDDDEPLKTVMFQSPFDAANEAPAPTGPTAKLIAMSGNDRGREFPLPYDVVVVGRSLEAGIVLNDPTVSRKHFEIHFRDGGWVLKDLGSGNGTRVTGQRVSEIPLEEGSQIEIGQTLLMFSSDADSTRAIQLPDEPAAEPQPAPKPPVQQVHVQPSPRIEVSQAGPEERRRVPMVPIGVGVVALLVSGVLLAHFVLGVRILPFDEQPAQEVGAPDAAAAAKAGAVDLYQRGQKALQGKDWDVAIRLFEQAGEKDKAVEGLDGSLARARDEKRNASLIAAARSSVEKSLPEEALPILQKVQDTSGYYPEARQMIATLGDPALVKEIDRIRGLVAERKKPDAKQAYVTMLEANPDDPRVVALADELMKAGIALDPPKPRPAVALAAPVAAPAPVPTPAPVPPPVPVPTPAPAREPAAPKAGKGGTGKLDVSRALMLYNQGAFDEAVGDLKSSADRLKSDDAAKARDLAVRIERFATAYNEGRSSLASKRLDKAEAGLIAALRADHDVNGHFDAEIRGLLGDTYRGRAAAAMQNTEYVQAAKNAKKALSYKVDDMLAKGILDKCMSVAQGLFDQANADIQAGRKDAARQKLRQVLDIVPATHQLADKATELMQQVR